MMNRDPTTDDVDRATQTPSQAERTVPPIPPPPVDDRPGAADDDDEDQAARLARAEAQQMELDLIRWGGEGGTPGDD